MISISYFKSCVRESNICFLCFCCCGWVCGCYGGLVNYCRFQAFSFQGAVWSVSAVACCVAGFYGFQLGFIVLVYFVFDIGPGAGVHGGEIVSKGTYQEIKGSKVAKWPNLI